MPGAELVAALGVVLAAATACAPGSVPAADGDGRVLVDDHVQPNGWHVRAGRGQITYQDRENRQRTSDGLVIEVIAGDEHFSTQSPLAGPADEEYQFVHSFGYPASSRGGPVNYAIYRAPAGTVLEVRYAGGAVESLPVGDDGLAVVVTADVAAAEEVIATGPDGTRCRFLRAPAPDFADCVPL